jgi:hypothetical protein
MWEDVHKCEYIGNAKSEWLHKNHFSGVRVDCFFCEYAESIDGGGGVEPVCEHCPAKKYDRKFDCENDAYYWYFRPQKFYKKLLSLNKKRNSK